MTGKIKLKNIRVYAYHGCLDAEAAIGSEYRVDLEVEADLQKSCESDALKDTVDYVLLNKIVKDEMAIRSKLLEHVAHRIVDRILKEIKEINTIEVEVAKINPPIGGDVEQVAVNLRKIR